MSDYDEYDGTDEQSEEPKPKPNWRRKLEADAEEGRRAQAERDLAQRELAFYRAGLPMDTDPRLAYFVKGYDGPLDSASIVKAATEGGFVEAAQTDPLMEQELKDHRAYTEASAGANVATKMNQQDALLAARKAADSAPVHLAAQVYADTLATLGFAKVQTPPA